MSDFADEVLRAHQIQTTNDDSLRAHHEKFREKVEEFEQALLEAAAILKARGVQARTVATITGAHPFQEITLTEGQAWDLGPYALADDGLYRFYSGRWPATYVVLHEKIEVPADMHSGRNRYRIDTRSLPDGSTVEVLELENTLGDSFSPARQWLVAAVAKLLP